MFSFFSHLAPAVAWLPVDVQLEVLAVVHEAAAGLVNLHKNKSNMIISRFFLKKIVLQLPGCGLSPAGRVAWCGRDGSGASSPRLFGRRPNGI